MLTGIIGMQGSYHNESAVQLPTSSNAVGGFIGRLRCGGCTSEQRPLFCLLTISFCNCSARGGRACTFMQACDAKAQR